MMQKSDAEHPVIINSLVSTSSVQSLILDPCCVELDIWLNEGSSVVNGKKGIDIGFYQMLDNPREIVPLMDCNYVDLAASRVRVSTSPPDIGVQIGSKTPSGYGESLVDLIKYDCSFAKEKFPLNSFCVHCAVKEFYKDWSMLVPAFTLCDYVTAKSILLFRTFLVSYEKSLKYSGIMGLSALTAVTTNPICFAIGTKPTKNIGAVVMDVQHWKVFWLAMKRKYHKLCSPISFTLSVEYVVGPCVALKLQMVVHLLNNQNKTHVVMIPPFGDFWAAIAQLFEYAHAYGGHKEAVAPFHYYD